MADNKGMFPVDFLFGAATASYQIEGAAQKDGRGPSIWDTFSHTPGKIWNGDTGDEACDHYHRFADDIATMAKLGLRAYRMSIAWPRVQPLGSGEFNQAGFDFYHRVLDELNRYGIEPIVTLYHWDLPQALEDAGGWPNRETVDHFAAYAARTVAEFKDKVKYWSTFNEPWCTAFLGYSSGAHAPGRSEPAASLAAAHHLNLAHGRAYRAIKQVAPDAQVAIVLNSHLPRPWNVGRPEYVDAARQIDALANRIFMDPYTKGEYPADLLADTAAITNWDFVQSGDLAEIVNTLDYLGVNYYSSHIVRHTENPQDTGEDGHKKAAHSCWPGADNVQFMPLIGKRTTMGWNVDPSGFHAHLVRMYRDMQLPIIVTENGASWPDDLENGRVRDVDRYTYLHDHLLAVAAARAEGVDIRGYMAWSLMDNFEWGYGYSKRFGLLYVDYETKTRIWKDSAYWYQATIKNGGPIPLDQVTDLFPAEGEKY